MWHDEHFLSGVAEILPRAPAAAAGLSSTRRARTAPPDAADRTLNAIARAARSDPVRDRARLARRTCRPSSCRFPAPRASRRCSRLPARCLIALTDEDRAQLDDGCPAGRAHATTARRRPMRRCTRATARSCSIMGLPGAARARSREAYVAQRLPAPESRRRRRHAQADLLPALDARSAPVTSRIVLDNTYVSRKSRAPVIRAAAGTRIAGSLHVARDQHRRRAGQRRLADRVALRQAARRKRARGASRSGTSRHSCRRCSSAISASSSHPTRPRDSRASTSCRSSASAIRPFVNRAVIVWCDGVLLRSRSGHRVPLSPDDVEVDSTDRAAMLRGYRDEGWRLLGISWQPEIGGRQAVCRGVAALFARMNELLGLAIEVEYCPHAAGPPRCWCRKPLPGLGVAVRAASSAGSGAVHLRRRRPAGSRLRAAPRVHVPRGE